MTLQEAKDQIAKRYGYPTWRDVDFYALNENAKITEPPFYKERLHDEAAEFFAREYAKCCMREAVKKFKEQP